MGSFCTRLMVSICSLETLLEVLSILSMVSSIGSKETLRLLVDEPYRLDRYPDVPLDFSTISVTVVSSLSKGFNVMVVFVAISALVSAGLPVILDLSFSNSC